MILADFEICINVPLKEGSLKIHFLAKQQILKLMFTFCHINYAGYITYQHIYLNNLLRKDDSIVKDLIINGHGASCHGGSFCTIHGDFVSKHFRKKRKELLSLSPEVKVLSFIYEVNK